MAETIIDLTTIKFQDTEQALFIGNELVLGSKNFIFAKNGSGKTTLSNAIVEQKSSEFDVQVFKGFESIIGENENLDAFSLAVDAGEKQAEIKMLEIKIKEKEVAERSSKQQVTESELNNSLYKKTKQASLELKRQEKIMDKFYKDSAKLIGDENNPQLVENAKRYNKNHFKNEISKANFLQNIEIKKFEDTLKSESKQIAKINFKNINSSKYLKAVNEIISSKVEEQIKLKRLDSQDKINFAKDGLEIHESGQLCAFCGNEVTGETIEELESYFSASEVKQLQERINRGKILLEGAIGQLDNIELNIKDFYPNLIDAASKEFSEIKLIQKENKDFLQLLYKALDDKEKNLFVESGELEIDLPRKFDFSNMNDLIDENNNFSSNLEKKKDSARDSLRFHRIKKLLDDMNYEMEKEKLESLKRNFDEKESELNEEKKHLDELNEEIVQLKLRIEMLKPRAEKQAVERINKKLRNKVQWQLDFCEGENSGYYRVKQEERYRSVRNLSTGEKNIIAFLYFVEKLEEIKQGSVEKPKLIVFDDPMSSNDDTMQYLIIGELQRLYQGKDRRKYDNNKDLIVILTHNVHFYLNVQPYGDFKDDKGKTKYDKNNFYRIDNHQFIKVTSQKDDFKTSYEALWVELKDLYDCGHKNAMLNSMRRIIETYIKFNQLNQDKFYRNNEQYLKLFNVNSHSIDDLSAETFTENVEEMKSLFSQIFADNGCSEHFKKYWG